MNVKYIFLAIAIISGSFMAFAANKDKEEISPEMKVRMESVKKSYDKDKAWINRIIVLEDSLEMFNKEADAVKAKENDLNDLEASIAPRIAEVEAQEENLKEKEAAFSRELRDMNEAYAKLCDIRLQQPYRQDRIEEALKIYKTIDFDCIDNFRPYYESLGVLLENYPRYYQEIYTVINNLQKDKGRNFKSENFGFRDKCKDMISATEYYKQYYKDRGNKLSTIPYLDSVITNYIDLLNNTKAGEFDFDIFVKTFLPSPQKK